MDQKTIDYLIEKHDLDGDECVRLIAESGYPADAIECFGIMPNSNTEDWFFAGCERDIKTEMEAAG